MSSNIELLLGLLDHGDAPGVSHEDFLGPHGAALRAWQREGFLRAIPGANPVPGCPHCDEGTPYQIAERFLCNRCRSTIDLGWLQFWPFDRGAFFGWLASALRLRGEVRPIDSMLWQLGTRGSGCDHCEVFYRRWGSLSPREQARLHAYRSALVLFGQTPLPSDGFRGDALSLLDVLEGTETLQVRDLGEFLHPHGRVRFDPRSGALCLGETWLGEVPVGSKECAFLARLAADLDAFVPYADLKRAVLRQTGSIDATEEATFCQKLKNRIKRSHIPEIDRLLVTTNKGDGYRLRAHGEP